MKSIVSLMTKRELPKRTENQVTQSSRDVKNFEDIVKDFKISARKMKEFYMKQDCFSSTYFSSTYYKPIRGTTKRGGREPNFAISVGRGNTIFDSNLVDGNILEKTMAYFW